MAMNIYRIAKEAGVSTTTVSRVINGKDGVGDETRKKILNLITKSNFQPRISKNKNNNIGIFLGSDFRAPHVYSPYTLELIDGLGSTLFDYNYNMLIAPVNKVPRDKNKYKVYCYKRNICAGIYINLCINDFFVNDFADVLPTATIGTKFDSPQIITVRSNNYKGAYDAINYLIEMGHRRIIFFVSNFNRQDYIDRREGFRQALEENGINYTPENCIIQYDSYSQAGIKLLIEELMSDENKRPTAFFIVNDREVLRFSSMLNELGFTIPNDVSVVGFDDYEYSEHFLPPLTTVRQPIFDMGKETALSMLEVLTNKRDNWGDNKVLETKLMIRKSVITNKD